MRSLFPGKGRKEGKKGRNLASIGARRADFEMERAKERKEERRKEETVNNRGSCFLW